MLSVLLLFVPSEIVAWFPGSSPGRFATALLAPDNLHVSPGTSLYEVILIWTDTNADEAGYEIRRSLDGVNWTAIGRTGSNGTAWSDHDTAAYTEYRYQVQAFRGVESGPTAETRAITGPAAVTGLTHQVLSPYTPTLSWQPSYGAYAYRVVRDGEQMNVIISTSWTETLPCGATYRYEVIPIHAGGWPGEARALDVRIVCDKEPPPTPANLQVSPIGSMCYRTHIQTDEVQDSGDAGIQYYRIWRDGELVATSNYAASSGGGDAWLVPGETYRYEMSALDWSGNESPRSSAVDYAPTCEPSPWAREIRMPVALIAFPQADSWPWPKSHAAEVMADLDSLVWENSYGAASVWTETYPLDKPYYVMPKPLEDYCSYTLPPYGYWYGCNYSTLIHDARAAIGSEIDFDSTVNEQIIIVFGSGYGPVGIGAGKYQLISARTGMKARVMLHELGHHMGLAHAGSWDCLPRDLVGPDYTDLRLWCSVSRYGDSYDPMGVVAGHFSAVHKAKLGWIQPDRSATYTGGKETFRLEPLEVPSPGLKEVKIPLDPHGYYYSLEYRRRLGWDAPEPEGVQIRLHVGRWEATDADTFQIATTVTPAEPFEDRYRGVRVTVSGMDAWSATVTVSSLQP